MTSESVLGDFFRAAVDIPEIPFGEMLWESAHSPVISHQSLWHCPPGSGIHTDESDLQRRRDYPSTE
jgi:hypothetical protein